MPVLPSANTAFRSEEEPSYGSKGAHGVTARCEVYAASITGSPDSTSAS